MPSYSSPYLQIRKADTNDFNAVYQFITELEATVFEINQFQKAFERNISRTDHIYLIAEEQKVAIGYLSCHIQELLHHGGNKVGEIQEMYVRLSDRNRGIGKKLIDELKRLAKSQGVAQLEVTANNKRIRTHQFSK